MGLFDKIKGPVFIKESSSMQEQLAKLTLLLETAPPDIAERIQQDIKLLNAGDYGENNIVFELKNSHIPMLVLHDVFLQHNGLTAQIDFLVITRKRVYILECKNLYGNIEINNQGDFIRTGSHGKKEGIYSPVTQNQRHLELIKQIGLDAQTNILTRSSFEKDFNTRYCSVVVLANPKTVLNAKFAKKDTKEKVIRVDQLIAYIQRTGEEIKTSLSEKEMQNIAQFFLDKHQPNITDYTAKYKIAAPAPEQPVSNGGGVPEALEAEVMLCPKCGSPMIKRTASKGQNAGKEFYGCSKYPKCRGIVNIK